MRDTKVKNKLVNLIKNAESLAAVKRKRESLNSKITTVGVGLDQPININTTIKPEIETNANFASIFYLWFLCHFWWFG